VRSRGGLDGFVEGKPCLWDVHMSILMFWIAYSVGYVAEDRVGAERIVNKTFYIDIICS
jgi:hypothetical protein